jgi:hypothetical protein
MSDVPTQLPAFGQASKLVALLDALGGVVISDGERASLIKLASVYRVPVTVPPFRVEKSFASASLGTSQASTTCLSASC